MTSETKTSRIFVCHITEILGSEVKIVSLPVPPDSHIPREAFVLRDDTGQLRAYLNQCQHLPIPLDAGSRDFLSRDGTHIQCSTHGAAYRKDNGLCIVGPCFGASLQPIQLVEENHLLWIEI